MRRRGRADSARVASRYVRIARIRAINALGAPVVVKASGLAAGKGVVVARVDRRS